MPTHEQQNMSLRLLASWPFVHLEKCVYESLQKVYHFLNRKWKFELSAALSRLHSVDEDVIVINASHKIIVECNLVQ